MSGETGEIDAIVKYDADKLDVDIETIDLEDGRLRSDWGARIGRVVLRCREPRQRDELVVTIEPRQGGGAD